MKLQKKNVKYKDKNTNEEKEFVALFVEIQVGDRKEQLFLNARSSLEKSLIVIELDKQKK